MKMAMSIDEAIQHCEEMALCTKNSECGEEHRQLEEWLRELKRLRAEPVRHGRWILQANNDRTNYRWNVAAECSECCDEKKEIWAGFFPNVPDWLARDVALECAKSVKLSNYCPNCGAKMDGGAGNGC